MTEEEQQTEFGCTNTFDLEEIMQNLLGTPEAIAIAMCMPKCMPRLHLGGYGNQINRIGGGIGGGDEIRTHDRA